MNDIFTVCWKKPDGDYAYLTAYGIYSLRSHIDYILGQGGRITSITNESL